MSKNEEGKNFHINWIQVKNPLRKLRSRDYEQTGCHLLKEMILLKAREYFEKVSDLCDGLAC